MPMELIALALERLRERGKLLQARSQPAHCRVEGRRRHAIFLAPWAVRLAQSLRGDPPSAVLGKDEQEPETGDGALPERVRLAVEGHGTLRRINDESRADVEPLGPLGFLDGHFLVGVRRSRGSRSVRRSRCHRRRGVRHGRFRLLCKPLLGRLTPSRFIALSRCLYFLGVAGDSLLDLVHRVPNRPVDVLRALAVLRCQPRHEALGILVERQIVVVDEIATVRIWSHDPVDHGVQRCRSTLEVLHVREHRKRLFKMKPDALCFLRKRMGDPDAVASGCGVDRCDQSPALQNDLAAALHLRSLEFGVADDVRQDGLQVLDVPIELEGEQRNRDERVVPLSQLPASNRVSDPSRSIDVLARTKQAGGSEVATGNGHDR